MEATDSSKRDQPKFPLGRLLSTPRARTAMGQSGDAPSDLLARHATGDWGDLCTDDKQLNDAALHNGDRLLSSYMLKNGVKLWIITEADRSATTYLLPDEY